MTACHNTHHHVGAPGCPVGPTLLTQAAVSSTTSAKLDAGSTSDTITLRPSIKDAIALIPVVEAEGAEASSSATSPSDPGCPVVTNSLAVTVAGSGPQGAFGGGGLTFFTCLEGGEAPDMMQAAKRDGQAAPTKDGSGLCLESCCMGRHISVCIPPYE